MVLSIAGADPSGGAGVAADLTAFAAHGVHGLSVITCITAQNTRALHSVYPLPKTVVQNQLDAVLGEFPIAAVKIGMLGTAAIVRVVVAALQRHRLSNIVLDPVLHASAGGALLAANALNTLLHELIPLTRVLTPNLPEARHLLRYPRTGALNLNTTAQALRALGAESVLLKGGHDSAPIVCDFFQDRTHSACFKHPRLPQTAHGTGCTLAAAIAAGLAHGLDPLTASRNACSYVNRLLKLAFTVKAKGQHLLPRHSHNRHRKR